VTLAGAAPAGLVIAVNGVTADPTLGVALPIDPGAVLVTATAPEYVDWTRTLQVAEGQTLVIQVGPLVARPPVVHTAPAAFSCMDAALDATSVYFTIVRVDETEQLRGDGIGRVSIATGEVESIALDMVGAGAGPRRIYLDGDDLYAVDPLVIGKLAKSALDGSHAFGE